MMHKLFHPCIALKKHYFSNIITMNKAAKKLMNRMIIQSWTASLNCKGTHTVSLNNTNTAQDAVAYKKGNNFKEEIQKVVNSTIDKNPHNLLKIVGQSYKIMDGSQAITVLSVLKKSKNDQLYYNNLKTSKEFENICALIVKNARSMNIHQNVHALLVLLSYNIPHDTRIIQILLQIIRVCINDLSLSQIIYLHKALFNANKSSLSTALLVALPHAFKNRMKVELDGTDTELMSKVFKFACKINNLNVVSYVGNLLLNNEPNIKNINLMYQILTTLPNINYFRKYLYKVEDVFRLQQDSLTYSDVQSVLHSISNDIVKNKRMDLYNVKIINILCSAIENSSVNFAQGLDILLHLNKMHHGNVSFLSQLTAMCLEDETLLSICSNIQLYTFIRGFVIVDHNNIPTVLLDHIIPSHFSLNHARSIAFHLISLNCYCPNLLEHVFSLWNSTFDVLSGDQKENQRAMAFLTLNQCVKTLYPQYGGPMLSEKAIDEIMILNDNSNRPSIQEYLKEAMGGTLYVKSGLRTKLGHFIDHVIVVQSNGSPMVTDCNVVTFVEELVTPPECRKLLIYAFPKKAYSINLQSMLSTWKVQLKSVEVFTGCSTLAINPYTWENISDNKKVEYLQQAIKSSLVYESQET